MLENIINVMIILFVAMIIVKVVAMIIIGIYNLINKFIDNSIRKAEFVRDYIPEKIYDRYTEARKRYLKEEQLKYDRLKQSKYIMKIVLKLPDIKKRYIQKLTNSYNARKIYDKMMNKRIIKNNKEW